MQLRLFDVRPDDPAYRAFTAAQRRAHARRGHQEMVRYGTDEPDATRDPEDGEELPDGPPRAVAGSPGLRLLDSGQAA